MSRLKLSERFLLLRHRQRWSQPKLAELLGVHPNTISNVEREFYRYNRKPVSAVVRKFEILEQKMRADSKAAAGAGAGVK